MMVGGEFCDMGREGKKDWEDVGEMMREGGKGMEEKQEKEEENG